jgi:hypothetical protein
MTAHDSSAKDLTVKQLAAISGVTVRTLHHYDSPLRSVRTVTVTTGARSCSTSKAATRSACCCRIAQS